MRTAVCSLVMLWLLFVVSSLTMAVVPEGSALCDFGVIRSEPRYAEVQVTPPGGFQRVLIFAGGRVTTSDGSEMVKAEKNGDMWLIDVNDYEHYQIPDTIITGD